MIIDRPEMSHTMKPSLDTFHLNLIKCFNLAPE